MRPKASSSPTARCTASPPASGPRTSRRRTAWPAPSRPALSGSTRTTSTIPQRRSAATSSRGSGETWDARRWATIRSSRPCGLDYECGVRNAECGIEGPRSVNEAYICAALRTPVGKHGGALAGVRADDLAAIPIKAVVERSGVDPRSIDDVILGCTNQAGEDNRNVARMALLLAGLPVEVPGQTVNRLCGSGLQAAASAAQAIKAGEGEVFIAGGGENMARAPYVMLKSGGGAARHGGQGRQCRHGAAGAHRRNRGGGRGSRLHGPGSHSGDPEGAQAGRAQHRPDRSRRAERGLRRAGDRLHARAQARPCESEHLRRGDRAGSSPRRHGRPDSDDSRTRLTPDEVPLRSLYDVHRRGPGDRHGGGARVMAAYDRVLVDIAEGIGTLTLARPEKLNALR